MKRSLRLLRLERISSSSLSSRCYYRNYTNTIDNNEIEKFSKIGKDWWDKGSSKGTGPLHAMNPTRVAFIRRCIALELGRKDYPALEQIRGIKILDVGCGGGLLSEALARLGAHVTAIDPSKRNIEIASEHSSLDPLTATINYKNMSIEEMASSGEKFDAVCSLEVIEHVDEPLSFLSSCCACLDTSKETAPSLILSTINRNPKSYAIAILGAEYILGMVPVGTHDWNKFIKPEELTRLVENSLSVRPNENIEGNIYNGIMKVKKIQGLRFNGLPGKAMSWSLDDNDIDVNYILHAVVTK